MTEIKELLAAIATVKQLKEVVSKHDAVLGAIQIELDRLRNQIQRLEERPTTINQ